MMKREPVSSTAIASVGYAAATATLEVEFSSGEVYRYFAVPAAEVRALFDAESMGAYLNRRIKPRYPCAHVGAA